MDRELQLTEAVKVSLDTTAREAMSRLAGAMGVDELLFQQLSTSVWAYIREECISIVTRRFTANARLADVPGSEARLALENITATSPQDVTAAFMDGYKIVATWIAANASVSAGDVPGPGGARALWSGLSQRATGQVTVNRILSGQEPPSPGPSSANSTSPPVEAGRVDSVPTVLPQAEIDRLISSLRGQFHYQEERPRGFGGQYTVAEPGSSFTVGAPGSFPTLDMGTGPVAESAQIEQKPAAVSIGLSLEEWTDGKSSPAKSSPVAAQPGADAIQNEGGLRVLLTDQSYAIVIFQQRGDFDRELEILRHEQPGTVLAFWEGQTIFVQLGVKLQARLEDYRAKYRAAAADFEASITRVRQFEQLLPNLQSHRKQLSSLAGEYDKIQSEMREVRLKQVVGTHEGRFLAKKVFAVEMKRRSLWLNLSRSTYNSIRRPTLSFIGRLHFGRARSRFFAAQRQLEACFDTLSVLEREVQRRLEYQADWQTLVTRQIKVQREMEEIGRFLKANTIATPSSRMGEPEVVERWLKAEWESVRRRERLLRAWQNCLSDERAWIMRTGDETLIVMGDSSLLALPGVARGSYVVMVAPLQSGTFDCCAPDECASWVMVDSEFKTAGSGRRVGQSVDPLTSTVAEMARDAAVELEEAWRTLGLAAGDLHVGIERHQGVE